MEVDVISGNMKGKSETKKSACSVDKLKVLADFKLKEMQKFNIQFVYQTRRESPLLWDKIDGQV